MEFRILLAAALVWAAAGATADAPPGAAPPGRAAAAPVSPFEQPAIEAARRAAAADLARGAAEAALGRLDALAARDPGDPATETLRAAALAALGRRDEGAAALARATALGLPELAALLASPALAALRDHPAVAALRPTPPRPAPPVRPAAVAGTVAVVAAGNTRWLPGEGLLESAFVFPPNPSRDRGPAVRKGEQGPEMALLAALRRRGAAAGHRGDLYDNRDRGHSRLDVGPFPQLDATAYAPAAQAAGIDYGLNDRLRFTATVFGNSSTALVDPARERSLPRLAMTTPGAPARLFALYGANHLYVYPEHRDHDPETGDLFPAALPYVLVSQGSSGSDQPLLRAVALALAALRPDTKAALRARGLIAPTVQMLLRLTRAGGAEAYLTGAAHPSAFDGASINLPALVRRANALKPDEIPPMAVLRAAGESDPGETYGAGLSERLFDTPAAVARVAHGLAGRRAYLLDARETVDPNGRPLRFHWRLLRGDPARVAITPRDDAGAVVEVRIDWHERAPAPGRTDIATDRVEIGLFADNGAALSAPAFFTLHFPPRQRRDYDADWRLRAVDFAAPDRAGRYEDPLLIPRRGWRDVFEHDAEGRLLGWRRSGDGAERRFTRHGALVLSEDAAGRALTAQPTAYPVTADAAGRLAATPTPAGAPWRYAYDGPDDLLGWLDAPPAEAERE